MPYAYAILNFDGQLISRHKSAHATLRAWRCPGSRYGWTIRPIEGGAIIPAAPGNAIYARDLEYIVERNPNA